jgi:hypothetical protein
MKDPGERRQIRNIMEFSSGLIVCLDQNCKRIDDYSGSKDNILPILMDKDLSQAKVKRKVQKEKGILFDWEFISVDELFNDLK